MSDGEALPPGHILANGNLYMVGAKGELCPPDTVKPALKLQDETTRSLFARAEALAAEISAFKAFAFDTVDAYASLLFEQYKAKAGGVKGNMSLFAFDGSLRVTVQTADRLAFGPEIQAAKSLIDECLLDWSAGGRSEIVALVQDAFRTDKEGQLNRYAILALRRHEFADERWKQAMQAITDSERVLSSARYIRFYKRAPGNPDGAWTAVSLNMATA